MSDGSVPKPGHFLPGGSGTPAGSGSSADDGASRADGVPGYQPEESAPLAAPTPRLGAPGGPPQLSGSRLESRKQALHGTRLGPPPRDDAAAAAYRAVYNPDPIPFVPKQRSKALVAGIVVVALLVVGGGVALAAKLLSSYDDIVANPLGTPSFYPTGKPADEPVAEPTPDAVIQNENPLYAAGKIPAVKCKEPAYRPTSKENVRSYYQTLIACMDKAWEPIVTKAGFEFRSPRLIIFDEGQETACGVQQKVPSYCADEAGGSVTMPWQDLMEDYPKKKALARVDMAQSLGFVYGVHLQNLTGIFDASGNLRDTAATKAAQLEQDRRRALQANCLSAVFFGAVKASFPLQGELLKQWTWLIRHSGDEHSKAKTRDHGSAKSLARWMNRGFASTDPGTCNTFVAASATVS